MNLQRSRLLLALIISVYTGATLVAFRHFTGDDTFIHLVFVKGLLAEGRFSFNGVPTYGTTSPLWVILIYLASLAGIPPEIAARLLGGICSILSVYLIHSLVLKYRFSETIALISATALAINGYFLRWGISGMEVSAGIALLLWSLLGSCKDQTRRSYRLAGLALGFGYLIRPELLAFLGIFAVHRFVFQPERRNDLFISLILAILPILAWTVYASFALNSILPNAFIAKASNNTFHFTNSFRTLKLLLSGNLAELLVMSLCLVISLKYLQREQFRMLFRSDFSLCVAWVLVFYGFYLLKDVVVISRYSLLTTPAVILGTAFVLDSMTFDMQIPAKRYLTVTWLILAVLINFMLTVFVIKPSADQFVDGFQKDYRQMAMFLRSQHTASGSPRSVALTDVGIIGYYSGLRVYDFAGIVDHKRFGYSSNMKYLFDNKPDFLIVRGSGASPNSENIHIDRRFELLVERTLPSLGINERGPVISRLYRIHWEKR